MQFEGKVGPLCTAQLSTCWWIVFRVTLSAQPGQAVAGGAIKQLEASFPASACGFHVSGDCMLPRLAVKCIMRYVTRIASQCAASQVKPPSPKTAEEPSASLSDHACNTRRLYLLLSSTVPE